MLVAIKLSAQPDWSVNPADFEFTMTVTSVGLFECLETMDENDIVAAFVNNEVRGVQEFNTDVEGRKFAFMIIYDNELNGSEISFKLYDASSDEIVNATNAMAFEENTRQGNVDDPYKFNTTVNLAVLALTNDTVDHLTPSGSYISEMLTVNEDGDTLDAVFDFVNDALGPHNSSFSISESILILEVDADIGLVDLYKIHLIGIAENGCSIDAAFELEVFDSSTVGIADQFGQEAIKMRIYPNPTVDHIILDTEEDIDVISFFDSNGRIVESYKNLPRNTSLSLAHLEQQIYFVIARSGNNQWSGKLVISDGL